MSCVLGVLLRVYSMFSHSPAPPPPAGSSDVQSKQHLFHWRQILPQMWCVFFRIECVLSLWECVLSMKCVLYIMCSLYTMYSAAIVTVLNMRGESVCILLYRMFCIERVLTCAVNLRTSCFTECVFYRTCPNMRGESVCCLALLLPLLQTGQGTTKGDRATCKNCNAARW